MLGSRRNRHRPRWPVGLGVALLLSTASALPASAGPSAAACQTPAPQVPPIEEVPWAQRWLAPDRVWPIATGDGVTVAVLDTGVDATHPQLSESTVQRGVDLLGVMPGGDVDCDGHGTAVGSIIAASNTRGIGFTGLAPDVEILPVRVAEQRTDPATARQATPIDPGTFARGLRWAVDHGARVVNVSIVFDRDHDVVRQAVRYALDREVIVVAAVGNQPETPRPRDSGPYPAAYDGVIGVGAIGQDGTLLPVSRAGAFVDLVAPGADVTAAARADGHQLWTGTSFAAPFVSASAALLLAADEDITASEAVRRLVATADPAGRAQEYGRGVVNPYRALTERIGQGDPVAARPVPAIPTDVRAGARAARWRRTSRRAAAVAAAVIAVGGAATAVIAIAARGRRRRSSTRWDTPPTGRAPVDDPERVFFSVPGPQDRALTRTGDR